MSDKIVVGTIRGKNPDGSYLVIKKDGKRLDVHLDGASPTVGSDIIGNVTYVDGKATMTLCHTVLDAILNGPSKIILLCQRPDITARYLSRLLATAKSAAFKPGFGAALERSPVHEDADVRWAMDFLKPVAEKMGLALNVIDVKAVTQSKWDRNMLQDFSLPADIEGSRRSKNELMDILKSGFHPTCSRVIERFSGRNEISVNFIIPYSPFLSSISYAKDIANMNINVFPLTSFSLSATRKLSSARHMAMAIAHEALSIGKGLHADVEQSHRMRHLTNSFADALACLMYGIETNDTQSVMEYGALRECSLLFSYDEGRGGVPTERLELATHKTLKDVVDWFVHDYDPDHSYSAEELVKLARTFARANAYPAVKFSDEYSSITKEEMAGAVDIANSIAIDISTANKQYIDFLSSKYKSDVHEIVSEHSHNHVAIQRLLHFSAPHVPSRLESVYYEETENVRSSLEEHIKLSQRPKTPASENLVKKIKSLNPSVGVQDFEMPEVTYGF